MPAVNGPQALGTWKRSGIEHHLLVEDFEGERIVAAGKLPEEPFDHRDVRFGVHDFVTLRVRRAGGCESASPSVRYAETACASTSASFGSIVPSSSTTLNWPS